MISPPFITGRIDFTAAPSRIRPGIGAVEDLRGTEQIAEPVATAGDAIANRSAATVFIIRLHCRRHGAADARLRKLAREVGRHEPLPTADDSKLRPVYFYPDQLEGHVERRYHPG